MLFNLIKQLSGYSDIIRIMSLGNKILAVLLLVLFMSTMFFSLFHLSMGMDMSAETSGCPFMSHEETICPMNLADHIGAWKDVFLSAVPSLALFLFAATSVVFLISTAPNLLHKVRRTVSVFYKYIRELTYTFLYRLFQELFSGGILNPKLF